MWLSLAFLSAALLGLYDVAKKKSLSGNAVLPVLLLNTLFSSLLFLPAILSAELGLGWFDSTPLAASRGTAEAHALVAVKSVIVLTSWIFGYFGMKHLPLTIVGPVNATRPVLVLVGALAVFGERLNGFQWIGVALALTSLVLLSRSGRREGVDFRHNVWILCLAAAAVTGAASGLYDKYIMTRLDPAFVQSWYNLSALAAAPRGFSFPLELGHSADFGLSLGCRFRLFLRPARAGRDDLGRLDGPPRVGRRVVSLRSAALRREEPAREGRRFGLRPPRHALPLAGVAVAKKAPPRRVFCRKMPIFVRF